MTLYGVCFLFLYNSSFLGTNLFIKVITPIVILTCIFPLNAIFLLKSFGVIKDYALSSKKDRLVTFLIVLFCYGFLLYYFALPNIPIWFYMTLTIPFIILLIGGFITFFWKISTHMLSLGGLIGATLGLSYYVLNINPYGLFIVLFILAGCLGTSRLILQKHTPPQVYSGFVVGLIISIIYIRYIPYLFIFRF